MRLLARYWFVAAFLGAVVGYGIRSLPRRPSFGVLVMLGILPVAGHAVYLYQLVAGAGGGFLVGQFVNMFMMVSAALLGAGTLAGWGLARSNQRLAAFVPALVGAMYAAATRFLLNNALSAAGVAPNALVGASVGMLVVGATVALLVVSWRRRPADAR